MENKEEAKLKMRVAFSPDNLSIRKAEEGKEESRIVEGRAIVFNEETTLWDDNWDRCREIISPSACTAEFLKTQDVKLNMLHERRLTVARCKMGEGNMSIDVREDGVWFTAEMPKCDLGNQALEMIRSGVYTGCSFEFYSGDYTREVNKLSDGRDDILITHTKFERVSALTLGMDPAYPTTSCSAREWEKLTRDEEELLKRQKEEEEAKHQQAREAEEAALKQQKLDDEYRKAERARMIREGELRAMATK